MTNKNQYLCILIMGLPGSGKTTVGKINDTSCIVMLYDVDMQGMQELMGSEFMITLSKEMQIINEEMHSFSPLQP